MSANITMVVPIKNTIAGVREVFTATGKGGAALMAAPVNNNPDSAKAKKTDNDMPVPPKDRSAASRISALYKQIENLQQKLIELKDSDADPKEIEKQKQLIINQIRMLQAEIERIQKEEMEKQQQEQMAKAVQGIAPSGDGINRPTAANAVDVYI
jgi:predicted RNase H-like nuclease (RuvC/YqgF family)